MADNAPDVSAIAEEMKAILQRVVQAKNSPQEVERTVAEGQKKLETLKTPPKPAPGSQSQPR